MGGKLHIESGKAAGERGLFVQQGEGFWRKSRNFSGFGRRRCENKTKVGPQGLLLIAKTKEAPAFGGRGF